VAPVSEVPPTVIGDSSSHWAVDDGGLTVPEHVDHDLTYDVLINDHHVWSLVPSRDMKQLDHGGLHASWPGALRSRLSGRATVAVRDHVSGDVVCSAEHAFAGEHDEEVDITDRAGRHLILDKYGRLTRPLAQQEPEIVHELLDVSARLLEVLRDQGGVAAMVAYGTLLGAVRDQRLIAHDNDIDLAYVSEHPHPVDVAREAIRIERVLRDAGYAVRRGSGSRLNIRVKLSDRSLRGIDVFTAHWVDGVLYMPSDTGFPLPRDAILPLGEVMLHGHPMPAPARAEELLAATYGEGWATPDPAFKYETPRALYRRLNGWFGGLITHRKYWDGFYAQQRQRVPGEPSLFAQWVAEHYGSDRPLVDVGCGTARDSLWFANEHGRHVTGLDYNQGVLRRGTNRSRRRSLDTEFHLLNLYDTRAALAWGAVLAHRERPCDVYARFLLHSLSEPGQENLLRLAAMALRREGLLFLEFRTPADAPNTHVFKHKRHYVAPERARELVTSAGGTVVHETTGTGLAPFESEDPVVCRMVASWNDRR
jgi:hypothetical protein